jgi:hypothetical protein
MEIQPDDAMPGLPAIWLPPRASILSTRRCPNPQSRARDQSNLDIDSSARWDMVRRQ